MAICGSTRNAMNNLDYPRNNTRRKNRLRKRELKKPLTPVRIRPADYCNPLFVSLEVGLLIKNVASLGTFYISIKTVNSHNKSAEWSICEKLNSPIILGDLLTIKAESLMIMTVA